MMLGSLGLPLVQLKLKVKVGSLALKPMNSSMHGFFYWLCCWIAMHMGVQIELQFFGWAVYGFFVDFVACKCWIAMHMVESKLNYNSMDEPDSFAINWSQQEKLKWGKM